MIEVQHISHFYGDFQALDDISFRLRNGRVYGLVGSVGCGRSTLLRIIGGSLIPREGTVLAGGYSSLKKPAAVRRQIGCLPAGAPLLSGMTVKEFLAFVAEAKGVRGEMAIRQVNEATVLCGLESVREQYTDSLTPVLRVRAGIAQALIGNPDNIVLDEPVSGLDDDSAAAVLSLIRRIGERKTVLISGERTDALLSVCDSLLILEEGRLTGEETVEHPEPAAAETEAGADEPAPTEDGIDPAPADGEQPAEKEDTAE